MIRSIFEKYTLANELALEMAVNQGNFEMIKLFVENNVEITQVAIDNAKILRSKEILDYLENAIKRQNRNKKINNLGI